ncbi:uncharacterized protein LOC117303652 isoform X2 [Asterias rubens]|uniref:uncharacterized protein LOC117303652 isoform X2 n=1 Tax=Asterias rubens TaxID=7604 RepID=UPI00145516C7|nr:uncharacterized protein LOC117303652 isoform X2 [Asterias rubens]
MKLVVLVASFLVVAVNAASFGSQRCTWGPAYWCDHPVKAKECGTQAVNYCIQNEWSKIKVDDESLCDECMTFIGEVHDVLNSGDLQTDVITLIKGLCDKLGSKAETCKELVDLFGKELLEKLVTELVPSKVCTLLDLCQKAPTPKIKSQLLSKVKADPCTDCKQIFTDLKDLLNNATVQKTVFNEVIMACEVLGLSADTCKQYINTYGPLVIDELLQFLDGDQICQAVGLCKANNKVGHVLLKKVIRVNADPCADCKQIFSDLDDILANKSVQQIILKQLIQVCTELGLSDTICQEVALFEPEVLNYIIQLLKPDTMCGFLGQCSSDVTMKLSKLAQQANKLQMSTANGNICTDCEQIIDDLKDLISNKTIDTILENSLVSLCESIGVSADICSQYIDEYGPLVLDFILSQLDSPTICKELQLCSYGRLSKLRFVVSTLKKVARGNGDACKDCKEILTDLDDMLNNSTVQNAIFSELINLCVGLGLPADQCSTYIKEYGSLVINYIEGFLQADQICTEAKLCVTSVNFVQPALLTTALQVPEVELLPALQVSDLKTQSRSVLGESADCTICQLIGDKLKDLLQEPSTQEDIESALEKVCSLLPSSDQDSCDILIEQYTPALTDLLLTDFPPEYLCQLLKLCSTAVSDVEEVGESVECVLCKTVIEKLDQLLEGKAAVADIEAALKEVCSVLPKTVQNDCDSFVTQYTPEIVKLLAAELSAGEICAALKLCTASSVSDVQDVEESVECVLCKTVIEKLDQLLEGKTAVADIEAALKEVCSVLPKTVQNDCDSFVTQYMPEIVKLLAAELSAGEICATLKLCTASSVSDVQDVEESVECVLCKTVIEKLDQLLEGKTAVADIEAALKEVCSVLPKTVQNDCDSFVTQYTPEIVKLLAAELSAGEICAALKLCTASSVSDVEDVEESVECVLCKTVIEKLDQLLEGKTAVADIEAALKEVCSVLPKTVQNDCDSFVTQYTPEIVKLLAAELSAGEICAALKLCTASSVSDVEDVEESVECVLCKTVIEKLDQLLEGKTAVADIEAALKEVCSVLPKTVQNDCDSFVTQYTPEIVKLLAAELSAGEICATLKLCTASSATMLKPVEGSNCGLCEEIARYVELVLKDGSTEKEIEDFLTSEICSKLEGEVQTTCLDVVERYLPEIIQLVTTMTPEKLCAVLGLCTAESEQFEPESKVDSDAECMICELIVKEMRSELSQNATQVEIQKFLDMVCSKVPLSKYSSECTGFVDDYTKPIIQLLLSEMDPDQICESLSVCSTNKKVAVSKVESGSLCTVCDVIFGIIDTQLEMNKTTEEVTKMIENVCTVLPDSLNKQCMSFLDLYGPMLLKLIVDSELEPNDICKEIKLCTPLTRPKLGNGTASCTACKEIVSAVEAFIDENKDEVIDEIAKVCQLFPTADQQECKNYVDVYGPYILDLLKEELFTPSEICSVLKMCPKSLGGLFNVDACKFGPTYWCASKQKAIKCGAVEHCSRHVWN